MNPMPFMNLKQRSSVDSILAVALLVAMLVPVWMIGNFIVDGGGGAAPAATTASPRDPVHCT